MTAPGARARRGRLAALWAAALAALACNLSSAGLGPAASPTPGGPYAVISEIVNQVLFVPSAGSAETPAASGQAVPAGSEVKTLGNARARLDLPEAGSALRLGQNTSLAVRALGGGSHQFSMSAGQVWLVLGGGQGTVETPGGSATTGGQMSVEYYPDDGTGAPLFVVTCLVEPCEANNPFGGLRLTAGQQAEAQGNAGLSDPHPIDPDRLAQWTANVPEMAQLQAPTATTTPTATATLPPEGDGAGEEGGEPEVPTDTETPVPTPPGAPCVIALEDAAVRGGPNTSYAVYGSLLKGQTAEVVGKDATGTWFTILFKGGPGGRGWVWGEVMETCGDHSNVPVLAAPITPTFTPSFTPSITPTVASPTPDKPGASITADSTTINEGDCTTLRWTATNAREVYLNGQGIAGETSREVCPTQTASYTLRVVGYDNSTAESTVTITVESD